MIQPTAVLLVYTAVLSVVFLVSNDLAQCFCEQTQAHKSKAGAIISVRHSGLHLQLLALPGIKRAPPFLVISFVKLDVQRYTWSFAREIIFFVLLVSVHSAFRTVRNLRYVRCADAMQNHIQFMQAHACAFHADCCSCSASNPCHNASSSSWSSAGLLATSPCT